MARQILPIVGSVVGGMFGAPQIGYAIGSIIGNAVDPIEVQGRKLGDAQTQVAAEGGARAIVYGKGCIRATVILERGGRDVVKQRDKSGKGSGPTTINERAFWTYAIGLGEAIPGGTLSRIWENEKLVYDITPESQIVADSAKFAEQLRFYDGAEDQLPDPALEALHGTGSAPYYRGTAYMVFPRRDLTDFGEAVPTYRVEVNAVISERVIDEVFDGYYATAAYPLDPDGFVFDPTDGGVFIIPVYTIYPGQSCIVHINDDWPGYMGGLYRYTILREISTGVYEETPYSHDGGGFIGFNLVQLQAYFIRCDLIIPPPGIGPTKVRADWYFYDTSIEQLLIDNVHVVDFDGTLGSVLFKMHERCDHTINDIDISEATDAVVGVIIEQTVTGAEAINSLIGCHFTDPSDYDGQIHYVKRGKPVVKTLTADDLIDEPESAQRNNAIEYPRKAHFLAQRADLAYANSKSTSARYSVDVKVVGEVSYTSPETFSEPLEPAEIAVKLHKVLWTEAEGERTWHVTDEHLDLVPSDTVGLSYRGELVRCRITQIEDDPGQRKLKMIRDRQSAYTATLTEIPNPVPPTPPQSSIVAPTVLAVMDLPALTDNADTLNYYVGMSGQNDQWVGAVLQQSLDAGASFGNIGNTTINAIMGTTLAAVSDASPYYTDGTNTVEVTLHMDDELESVTPTAFLSNGGAFALSWQDSGETQWELMQYRDAEHVSGNTWRLSHLLRGRKNTESAAHPVGAVFVLIDTSILRQSAQTAWLGTDLTHRAVSNGLSPETATPQTNGYIGNSQREWPVASITLSRPDPDTVAASVVPRHRFGSSMNPVRSINWEGYRWTATDGTNTINRDGTAATETFDTTGWASPVSVTVAQLNRLTGPGDAVTEDIA